MLAIDLLDSSFQYTKQLFFPIHKRFWLKLGFVSLLSSNGRGSVSNLSDMQRFGNFGEIIQKYWKIALMGFGAFVVVSWFWNIIQNTLTFVFIDSLLAKEVRIREGFHKHLAKGISLFLFNLVLGLIMLLVFVLLALPIALPIIRNWGHFTWDILSIPYLVFAGIAFVCLAAVGGLINMVVYNFTIIEMYIENNRFLKSFRTSLKLIRMEKKEAAVYLLLRIGLGIVSGIVGLFLIILIALPFVFVGGLCALAIIPLYLAFPPAHIILITLTVGLGVVLILLFAYAVHVITLPITGFFTMYAYLFMSALRKAQSGSVRKRKQASPAQN